MLYGYQPNLALLGVLLLVVTISIGDQRTFPRAGTTDNERLKAAAQAAVHELTEDTYSFACQPLSRTRKVPGSFILSVVAAENYLRPAFRRDVEIVYARLYLSLLGRLPEISLGVGQIKPDTARKVFLNGGSDENLVVGDQDILAKLTKVESNVVIVGDYLEYLFENELVSQFDVAVANKILQKYNGQLTERSSAIQYRWLVMEIYNQIQCRSYYRTS